MNGIPYEIEQMVLAQVENRLVARQVCWQWKTVVSGLITAVGLAAPAPNASLNFAFLKDWYRLKSVSWTGSTPFTGSVASLWPSLPPSVSAVDLDGLALSRADFEALAHSPVATSIQTLGISSRTIGIAILEANLGRFSKLRNLRATPDLLCLSHTVFASLPHLESVTVQVNSKSVFDTKITLSASIIKQCEELQPGSMRLVVASCQAPKANELEFSTVEAVAEGRSSALPRADCRYIISYRNKSNAKVQSKQQIGALLSLCLWLPDNADAMAKARYQSSKEILKRFLPSVEEKTATNLAELALGLDVAV